MKYCPECGFEFSDDENFCPKCGKYVPGRAKPVEEIPKEPEENNDEIIEKLFDKAPEETGESTPCGEKNFREAFKENISADKPFEDLSTPSVWSFVLTLFLCSIPFVGFIYLFVLAFGGTKYRAKKNYARAIFLYAFLIAVAVSLLVIFMVFFRGNEVLTFLAFLSEKINFL